MNRRLYRHRLLRNSYFATIWNHGVEVPRCGLPAPLRCRQLRPPARESPHACALHSRIAAPDTEYAAALCRGDQRGGRPRRRRGPAAHARSAGTAPLSGPAERSSRRGPRPACRTRTGPTGCTRLPTPSLLHSGHIVERRTQVRRAPWYCIARRVVRTAKGRRDPAILSPAAQRQVRLRRLRKNSEGRQFRRGGQLRGGVTAMGVARPGSAALVSPPHTFRSRASAGTGRVGAAP